MYDNDPRVGYPESGTVTITDGDGNTPQTVINTDPNELFVPTAIHVQYASGGTGTPTVALYDDADGTSSGNVSDARFRVQDLAADADEFYDNLNMRDFENDVLVQSEGDAHDSDIEVNVMGYTINALADMQGVA